MGKPENPRAQPLCYTVSSDYNVNGPIFVSLLKEMHVPWNTVYNICDTGVCSFVLNSQ